MTIMSDSNLHYNPNSELVLGIVSAVGTDLDPYTKAISKQLGESGYTSNIVRVSTFLSFLKDQGIIDTELIDSPEAMRIRTYMDGGNDAREIRPDILALCAADEIYHKKFVGDTDPSPLTNTAHIICTLKNPSEVETLRSIYGPGFFLIAIFSPEEDRLKFLGKQKKLSEVNALQLIERDQGEIQQNGQQTRDTFQLADAFVGSKKDLERILELLFGNPFKTPQLDEHAMFLAYSASLRSADLSRQVGAVVVSEMGEVIATGCNDVPCSGGGLYWTGENDDRDFIRGYDSNRITRGRILDDIIDRLCSRKLLPSEKAEESRHVLERGEVGRITEYGRAVHAEMEALLACARVGASPRKGTLYTTVYPCHNCAKHIIASGVSRVVFVEPYPKSRALELHDDAIKLLSYGEDYSKSNKVVFQPFVGVGPRRYFDLFSMRLGSGYMLNREDNDGKKSPWSRKQAILRCAMEPTSYLKREDLAAIALDDIKKKANRE